MTIILTGTAVLFLVAITIFCDRYATKLYNEEQRWADRLAVRFIVMKWYSIAGIALTIASVIAVMFDL